MTARIFKPAKNAMQSGRAKTREWQLDYEPEQPRAVEPLMGWTSSGDMKQQLTLHFETKEDAIAYCERKGIAYQVIEPKDCEARQVAYADNFAFRRGRALDPLSTLPPRHPRCFDRHTWGAAVIPRRRIRLDGQVSAAARPWRHQAPGRS